MDEESQANNWVKIFESPDQVKVGILKQLMEDYDIEAVMVNKKDSMYNFGEVELYVNATKAVRAHHLISSNEFKP
jgi:Flp pilus assembly CpaF family ATPase